jgi:hypothetical protein
MGAFAGEIELAEAVEAIRDQLLAAAARNAGAEIKFQVGPIAMEFTVELRREASAKGEVKAWVLGGGAEGKVAKGNVHKVQITLTPVDAESGRPYEIANPELGDLSEFAGSAG